jgi:glutamine amidotransferase
MEGEIRFYFVHSFYVDCQDPNDVASTTTYGEPFASAVTHGNVYGVQFHPEKSHRFGMRVLTNFAEQA